MCGRYAIFGPVSRKNREVLEFLELELDFKATYNAAPTQQLPVLRVNRDGEREVRLVRWGLVPYWAKNAAIGAKMINVRAEGAAERFRSTFLRRRCLVPMSGFYEWRKTGAIKIPHYVRLLNTELFAAAGLYEYWPGKDGAAPIESYAILTTEANELMRSIHDRMPALLHEADYQAWLDPANQDLAALEHLLKPYPAEEMRAYPVSTRVNSATNDGPELIEPVALANDELFGS